VAKKDYQFLLIALLAEWGGGGCCWWHRWKKFGATVSWRSISVVQDRPPTQDVVEWLNASILMEAKWFRPRSCCGRAIVWVLIRLRMRINELWFCYFLYGPLFICQWLVCNTCTCCGPVCNLYWSVVFNEKHLGPPGLFPIFFFEVLCQQVVHKWERTVLSSKFKEHGWNFAHVE
jgi:hypothetical protein